MDGSLFGTLIVVFGKARNLPNRRSLGKQNPYCIARIGNEAQRCPSDIRGGQTPAWDHEIRFQIMDIIEHGQLKLSVLDENDSKVDLIGDTVIDLKNAFNAKPKVGYDHWHELKFRGKYAGEVYLELTFYPARPALPPKGKSKKSSSARSSVRKSHSSSMSSSTSRPLPYPEDFNMTDMAAALPSYRPSSSTSSINSASSSFSSSTSSFRSCASRSGSSLTTDPLLVNSLTKQLSNQSIPRKPLSQNASPTKHHVLYGDDENFSIPFSPQDYNAMNGDTVKAKRKSLPARPDGIGLDELLAPINYHPEPVPRPSLPPIPTQIDAGLAGYHGGGQWDISRQLNDGYSDSVYNKAVDHKLPRIPPKIPQNLTEDEYLALESEEMHPYYYKHVR